MPGSSDSYSCHFSVTEELKSQFAVDPAKSSGFVIILDWIGAWYVRREAVDAVLSVFGARAAEAKEAMSNATKGLEAAQQKTKEELPGLSVSVSLDVAAPRVIVPVSSFRDDGFLLLDMGHMLVEGGSVEGGVMAYRGEFRDMNARLPAKKSELLMRESMDAIIEPFGVTAHATVGGGVSEPGVVLAMEVMPGVKGVISPEKIRGLHRVLDYVTKADLQTFLGLGASGDTAVGGGGDGVERMGEADGLVAIDLATVAGQHEPLVLWEWRLKVPTIGLLLVEPQKGAANKDNGLLAEASGTRASVIAVCFAVVAIPWVDHGTSWCPSQSTHVFITTSVFATHTTVQPGPIPDNVYCRHVNERQEHPEGHGCSAPSGRCDGPRHGKAERFSL